MKQRPTILFLVRLYHPHIGGVEKHVHEVSQLLKQEGFRLTIITEQFDIFLPQSETLDGIVIYRIPIGKNEMLKKFFIWKWILLHLHLFIRSDVIHVHDVFYWILPFRLILVFKKIFTTFHGYEGYPVKMRWIAQRKMAEILSGGTICVGDFMKKWYFANPTYVIYGGVSLRGKIKLIKQPNAVFFGRLDDQTGIHEYIKAYNIIRRTYPDFKLTVVGEGKFEKKINTIVKVLPFTNDVEEFIAQNRFIFVSRYLSMLEALVQKKEIIATYNSPIMKDYILMSPFKNYVSLCETSEEIAKTVIKSLRDGQKTKIEKGNKWARQQTWEKIVNVYVRLWRIK